MSRRCCSLLEWQRPLLTFKAFFPCSPLLFRYEETNPLDRIINSESLPNKFASYPLKNRTLFLYVGKLVFFYYTLFRAITV